MTKEKLIGIIEEFLQYKFECEDMGRGYDLNGFAELVLMSEQNPVQQNVSLKLCAFLEGIGEKYIVVKWIKEKSPYMKAMIVIESNHERFIKGMRFDYGFFKIANNEGYTIISLPTEH